jgi:hypothetical protein
MAYLSSHEQPQTEPKPATPPHPGSLALAPTRSKRMKSHELFAVLPVALAAEIFEDLHQLDRQVYRVVLDAVAQTRKVRTVYLERLPRVQRHTVVLNHLKRPGSALLADNLLRTWLLKKHKDLLSCFLDALNITHQDGVVENLPEAVDDQLLQPAVDSLLAKHRQDIVALYLHAFNEMNDARWLNLDALLQNHPKLRLVADTPAAATPDATPPGTAG